MKRLSKYHILPAVLLIAIGAVLGVQLDTYLSDDDVGAQLDKMRQAFLQINQNYVDDLKAEEIAEAGVEGMVNSLDPHSTYIPADRAEDVKDQYQGTFGGIGIVFEVPEDTARVISPLAGGPSEEVGVMAGDRIVGIEDSSAVGLSSNEIQNRLKGEIDTRVQMTVYRPTTSERMTFTITREEIETQSVRSPYMVDEKTGYINITRFTMKTHDEFRKAARTLLDKGMERLVLDLRGNPGGVMRTSWQIANEMLGKGMTIVETKGRGDRMNQEIDAKAGGMLVDQPIIVLVSRGSASASEILTGALQDHDRAFIVGRRTFGKGLIQKQFDLKDNSVLQMTVGRYYTPVGRLIQSPYERGDRKNYYRKKFSTINQATYHLKEYRDSIPDSLAYETDHGRMVFGGGGILPDYVVQPDTTALTHLVRSGLDYAFARKWFSSHETELRSTWQQRSDEFQSSFEPSDEMIASFWSYAEENGVTITEDPDSVNTAERIYAKVTAQDEQDFVATRVKGYLARLLYGRGVARPVLNRADPVFREAMSLWPSSRELAAYHTESSASTVKQK
ncbi:MAG: S41 family peptidase [Bacteroidetes bacterium QS_4_64_154]|nr:MAG: S41 family peptidase [Bacteroidetes bacterium QS_4_64_154]